MRSPLLATLLAATALIALPLHAQTDVVRFGVINDHSGPLSDMGGSGSVVAARMAVEDMGGVVAGKKVEVIGGDNQSKVDIASSMLRRWFDTENLVAVIAGGGSATSLAMQAVAIEKGGAVMITGGFSTLLAGKQCSKLSTQWVPDTYAYGSAIVKSMVESGGKSWFFITADYAGGISTENTSVQHVLASGGTVVGRVRHPFGGSDFASFLLQAQASRADVIGLATSGSDVVNLIKQAQEFGLMDGRQRIQSYGFISDIEALGLELAQGLMLATGFYWDLDEDTRAWTRRWQERMNTRRLPTVVHAASYSAALHYLQAAQAAGSFDGVTVNQKMRELPITSKLLKNASMRPEEGRVLMDMYTTQVKAPTQSRHAGDLLRIMATIPGEQAFSALTDSECPLVNKP